MTSYAGFDTAEELIRYCELHCQSERALFSGEQINEMLRLAGRGKGYLPDKNFYPLRQGMPTLCRAARRRLHQVTIISIGKISKTSG